MVTQSLSSARVSFTTAIAFVVVAVVSLSSTSSGLQVVSLIPTRSTRHRSIESTPTRLFVSQLDAASSSSSSSRSTSNRGGNNKSEKTTKKKVVTFSKRITFREIKHLQDYTTIEIENLWLKL